MQHCGRRVDGASTAHREYLPTCDHSLQEKAPAVTDYLFAINEKLGEAVRAVPVSTAAGREYCGSTAVQSNKALTI